MRTGLQPLTDTELAALDDKALRASYRALRLAYEDAQWKIARLTQVHEGPNGAPRDRRDVSANSRLTATIAERKRR